MIKKTAILIGMAMLFFPGCGPASEKAAFTGTWEFKNENIISGKIETSEKTVAANPPKFRITQRYGDSSENVMIFDGKTLTNPYGGQGDEDRAARERFWQDASMGPSAPGGLIAGRDTLLYGFKEQRRDGEFVFQWWMDAEKGILLKKIETIYSAQVQSIVTRNTIECKSIDFTPPADSLFTKP